MAYPITVQKLKNILDLLQVCDTVEHYQQVTIYVKKELEKTEKEMNQYLDLGINILKALNEENY